MPISFHVKDITHATEKYLVVLGNCIETHVTKESRLSQIYDKYPYGNIYHNRKISGKKGKPGSIEIKSPGTDQSGPMIINILSLFYLGQNNFPNDNHEKRLFWFKRALSQISDIRNVTSIAFSQELIQEAVGNKYWDDYLVAIQDFDKMLMLKDQKTVYIVIYTETTIPVVEKDTPTPENTMVKLTNLDDSIVLTTNCFRKLKVITSKKKIIMKKREPATDVNQTSQISQLVEAVTGWKDIFSDAEIQDELKKIDIFYQSEIDAGENIYPPYELIFNAFHQCPPESVKILILGMDPYINPGEAMGMSFSVPKGVKVPPSLKNIFTELSNDIPGFTIPNHGDLTSWAKQGILLLNSSLTVRGKKSGSHLKVWKKLTDRIIHLISEVSEHPTIFMLWGLEAKKKQNLIDIDRHIILTANHPSPLSANKGGFFGTKHFSQANEELIKMGLEPINWNSLIKN